MPKRATAQSSQSVNGLFQALGVDPRALPRTRPFYRRLVALLDDGIARGALRAGFQLPPERDLAAALAVSRATVVSAYRELEARGLVRGYVGRGTFVSARPDAAGAPFAWRGKMAAATLQATETTVRDLVRAAIGSGRGLAGRRRAGARMFSDRRVPARDEPGPRQARGRGVVPRADRGDAAVSRRARRALRRRAGAHPRARRRAAGARSARPLPDRSAATR